MPGIRWMTLAVVAASLLSCGNYVGGGGGSAPPPASGPQSHGGPVRDHVSFVDALRAKGLTVDILGEIEQVVLKPRGTRLRLSGAPLSQPAEVQSFNYEAESDAQADASQLTPEGQSATTMIMWVDDPHFYRKERVVVLYVGKDRAVLSTLESLLGPQIAGR